MTDDRVELVAEVKRWSSTIAEWTLRLNRATSTRDELEASIGKDVLNSPDEAEAIAARLARRKAEVEVASRALESAAPQFEEARVAVLEVDAAEMDRMADELQEHVATHDAKTAKLVAQLGRHEGTFALTVETIHVGPGVESSGWMHEGTYYRASGNGRGKSTELQRAVDAKRLGADIIRDVIAGVDPARRVAEQWMGLDPESLYPPSVWGPDAVIAAPAFVRKVDEVRSRLADHEAEMAKDDDVIVADLEASIEKWDLLEAQRRKSRLELDRDEAEARSHCYGEIRRHREWRTQAASIRAGIVSELEVLVGATRPVQQPDLAVSA